MRKTLILGTVTAMTLTTGIPSMAVAQERGERFSQSDAMIQTKYGVVPVVDSAESESLSALVALGAVAGAGIGTALVLGYRRQEMRENDEGHAPDGEGLPNEGTPDDGLAQPQVVSTDETSGTEPSGGLG